MTTTDTIAAALAAKLRDIAPEGIDMEALQLLADDADAAISRLATTARGAVGGNSLDAVAQGAINTVLAAEAAQDALEAVMAHIGITLEGVRGAEAVARNALHEALLECGDPGAVTIGTRTHVAFLTNGRPTVDISDATKLPATMWREKLEPNKAAIGALLRAGQQVPGAALRVSPPFITIKAKQEVSA